MKKFKLAALFFLIGITFFTEKGYGTLSKEETEKLNESEYVGKKFRDRRELRQREIVLLARECNVNKKRSACLELVHSKKASIDESMEYFNENDHEPELLVGEYCAMYSLRRELYDNDDDILSRYKDQLPQDIYNALHKLEEYMKSYRKEVFSEDGMMNELDVSQIVSFARLEELQKNNPESYKALIRYFAESIAARNANAKDTVDSPKKMIDILERGLEQKTLEEQEEIYDKIALFTHERFWRIYTLSLEEVRQKLRETE